VSLAAPSRAASAAVAGPGPEPAPAPGGWIVSPAFDLLFLANLGWPLVLLPWLATAPGETAVDFWQIYFLTLPHRWLTLVLVGLDPARSEGRGMALTLIACAAMVLVFGVWAGTGALTCLAVLDYAWNAWHFAAQNAGVLRMYARKVGGGPALLERHGVRLFVTYAVLRTAGWATGWLEADPRLRSHLHLADAAVLVIPALLVGQALATYRRERLGKVAYTLSLCTLYAGLIVALALRAPAWVVGLATASSLFHAVEYLAVVTHYARRRRTIGPDGAFRRVARHWPLLLAAYAVLLGTAGSLLDRPDSSLYELWIGLNVWAALVHYAFDGMIWKLRRPDTARALGVAPGGAA
jgi:hypothetical protein